MRWIILAALATTLAACDDKGDEGDTGDTGDGAPAEGHWTSVSSVSQDTCGLMDDWDTATDGTSGFTLVVDTATTFSVTLDEVDEDGWHLLSCTVAGTNWTCDQHVDDSVPSPDWDATVHATQDVSGTFPTWTTMTGLIVVQLACVGKDCDTLATHSGLDFPCVVNIDMTAEADG